ncbi:hypothetical protein SAMN05444392_1214 [Seinonella peptonophila]|uniref:Uncharacterized protein n=1 Tax=Seinonella peptonophila TaxID=112248 RepID=A0A1M5BC79_9BACL|nr:hypothetical protein [Seinonella peptonophila]SHF40025.1 hypothetical protein SAMN05444392_1214 [Seinonella peptonophila]
MDQSFRPLRGAQIPNQTENENNQTKEPSTTPAFQRQSSQDQAKKHTILPEWDLLPPRKTIRRKGI